MNIDPAIFRAYDIRGKVGQSLNPQISQLVGKAFGTHIKNLGGQKVSVSRDNRQTSKELAENFIDGVVSTGLDVIDLGLITAPMLYFSIIHKQLDGGAMVTASHNEPEYNGIKLCKNNALHIHGQELQQIEQLSQIGKFRLGQGKKTKEHIYSEYRREVISRIKLERKIKLAVDCSDGVSSLFAPKIFEKLGCQVAAYACAPRGDFPHGGADPSEPKNLSDLADVVIKNQADLGVGLDPDADRLGVIDEKGNYAPIEAVAALIAKDILQGNKFVLFDPRSWMNKNEKRSIRFVYDVKSLSGFGKMVEKYGGRTGMLPTGRSYFRQKLFEDRRIALGVEASGHIHINDGFYGFDDAIFAAARLLEILSESEKTLSALLADFPKSFYTSSIKPYCPDKRKFLIVEEVKQKLKRKYDTIDIDGVKFFLDKNSWGLLRASNTGPRLSLRFEADTKEKVLKLITIVDEYLKRYSEVDQSWVEKAYEEIR